MAIRTVVLSPRGQGDEVAFAGTARAGRVVLRDEEFRATLDLGSGGDQVVPETDVFFGGTILAGAGNNRVRFDSGLGDGGAGNDRLELSSDETVRAAGGNGDVLVVSTGNFAAVDGGAGNDTIEADSDAEGSEVLGGDGNDRIEVRLGAENSVGGGVGNDSVTLAASFNAGQTEVFGGTGNDVIRYTGEGFALDIHGGPGRDSLVAGDAADTLHFTPANTPAGRGRDVVSGFGDGQDLIALDGDANRRPGGTQDYAFVGETRTVDAGEVGFFERGGDTIVVGFGGRTRFEVELDRFAGDLDAGDFLL